jgi:tRNA-modifying protein YgfZ
MSWTAMPLSVVRVSGDDARALLQRLTTNDVIKPELNEPFSNVFTSDKGRVLELCTMIVREDGVWVFGQVPGIALVRWIKKMTFREKVIAEDFGDRLQVLTMLSGDTETAGVHWSFRGSLAGIEGSHVVVDKGTTLSGEPLDTAAFEHHRIRAGVPWLGKDVGDDNNPHEANLGAAISWDKGCYIGQEVVARLDTYDKVQRHLRRIRLSKDVPTGSVLTHAGEDVGRVTSVSERDGETLGLAYVHKKAAAAIDLKAGDAEVTVLT